MKKLLLISSLFFLLLACEKSATKEKSPATDTTSSTEAKVDTPVTETQKRPMGPAALYNASEPPSPAYLYAMSKLDPEGFEVDEAGDTTVFQKGTCVVKYKMLQHDAIFNDLIVEDSSGKLIRFYTEESEDSTLKDRWIRIEWRDAIEYHGLGHEPEDKIDQYYERTMFVEKLSALDIE